MSVDVDFSKHYRKNRIHDALFRWVDASKKDYLAKKYEGKGFKILDYGCGTGEVSSAIKGCKLYGVDNNKSLLRVARKNGLDARIGDFESIPFNDSFFDVVVSVDSLEHVKSRSTTLAEIKRVLKNNGEFVVFTPCYDSVLWVAAEKAVNVITRRASGHLSPFIKESLDYYLLKNFKISEKARCINFSLSMVAWAKGKK